MIAVYSIDKLLLLIVFFTPFSIKLSYLAPTLDIDAHLPTEPLMLGLLIIVVLKYFHGQGINRAFLRHPVSIAIYLNLIWLLITSVTSTMPVVSFKFLLARIWFLVTFYFIAAEFFKSVSHVRKFIWAYTLPLILVVFIILYKLSNYGFFNQHAAHFVVKPFFNDHTSYGAIIAFLLPVIAGFLFAYKGMHLWQRLILAVIFGLFIVAVVLSYTRAAWVSIIGAVLVLLLILIRIRFFFLAMIGLVLTFGIYSYRSEIILRLKQNRQDSSKELSEHVKSISNVATDASNLERLNRWSCAWRMFKDKPVFGWGPGTYMFKYSPFQIARERTIISTDFANMGNAHSEYIGPLAESGLPGSLTFIAVVVAALITGYRVYRQTKDRDKKVLGLSILLGLVTYLIHGTMNNFLDTDKASVLFWGFIAVLVVFDIQNREAAGDADGATEE
jgi:O-antigen ligase